MSGIATSTAIMYAAVAAGIGASVYNGQQQSADAKKARDQAAANAKKTELQADMANNKANQKSPDTSAILDAQNQAGKSGVSGTMLTGPGGVNPAALTLGKSTLLGL